MVANDDGGCQGNGADLESADGLEIEVAGEVPEGLAQQGGTFGVKKGLFAVDVVGALLAGSEGECPKETARALNSSNRRRREASCMGLAPVSKARQVRLG